LKVDKKAVKLVVWTELNMVVLSVANWEDFVVEMMVGWMVSTKVEQLV
jgi:hypothetical protein